MKRARWVVCVESARPLTNHSLQRVSNIVQGPRNLKAVSQCSHHRKRRRSCTAKILPADLPKCIIGKEISISPSNTRSTSQPAGCDREAKYVLALFINIKSAFNNFWWSFLQECRETTVEAKRHSWCALGLNTVNSYRKAALFEKRSSSWPYPLVKSLVSWWRVNQRSITTRYLGPQLDK